MDQKQEELYVAQVLSGVAHEIRNPLQGIIASAAVLNSRLADDTTLAPTLEMIHRETARINQMIDNMLELGRPICPGSLPCHLSKVLDDAVRNVEVGATPSVNVHLDGYVPAIVCDAGRLSAALAAVLKNAIEANARSVEITTLVNMENNILMIAVQDDGEGLGADARERAFQPFFSTRHKKAGLGLSVAEHIIRAHGGTISIEPAPNTGTIVRISLPMEMSRL